MLRVSEVEKLKVGQHIRWRRLGHAQGQDGAAYTGEVVGHDPDGSAIIATPDGATTRFNFARGDRLFWLSNKPWSPARMRVHDEPPLVERERHDKAHKRLKLAMGLAAVALLGCVGLGAALLRAHGAF